MNKIIVFSENVIGNLLGLYTLIVRLRLQLAMREIISYLVPEQGHMNGGAPPPSSQLLFGVRKHFQNTLKPCTGLKN